MAKAKWGVYLERYKKLKLDTVYGWSFLVDVDKSKGVVSCEMVGVVGVGFMDEMVMVIGLLKCVSK